MHKTKTTVLVALLLIAFAITAVPATTASPEWSKPKVPSSDEIFGWLSDICDMGWRIPGSPVDHQAEDYIVNKFIEFGLQDVHKDPIPMTYWSPLSWSLTVHTEEGSVSIPCWWIVYTGDTGPQGVTAEMVYLGYGTKEDFASKNVEGKIVVVDLPRSWFIYPWLRYGIMPPPPDGTWYPPWPKCISLFDYDPEGWFPQDYTHKLFIDSSPYARALAAGAAGFVGICVDYFDSPPTYFGPYDGVMKPLPGLYVGPEDGNLLRSLITDEEPVKGTLVLDVSMVPEYTNNVLGWLPGRTDDIIIIHSHHDGTYSAATEDASGISMVLALAKYFGQIPQCCREKTLLFLATAGHMYGSLGSKAFVSKYKQLLDEKLVTEIGLEHIYPREYLTIDHEFVPQDHPTFQGIFVSANPCLISYTTKAVVEHDLKGTGILSGPPISDAGAFYAAGYPIIAWVSGPEYLFDINDTPDKIMVEYLNPVASAFVDIVTKIDATPKSLIRANPPLSLPIELYQGYGWMSIDDSYQGNGMLYVTDKVIYLGVEESGWIAWDIVQQWQHRNVKIYKCQSEWGILWVHTDKKHCVAIGPAAFFVGKVV